MSRRGWRRRGRGRAARLAEVAPLRGEPGVHRAREQRAAAHALLQQVQALQVELQLVLPA